MILIISNESDKSTNEVIDWLEFYGEIFLRISDKDKVKIKKIELNTSKTNIQLLIKNISVNLSEIKSIWYRRGWLTIDKDFFLSDTMKLFKRKLKVQLVTEFNDINRFIIEIMSEISLNKPTDNHINKLTVLKEAKQVGLNVPQSLICSYKLELLRFAKKAGKLITKNVTQGLWVDFNKYSLNSLTERVTNSTINEMPEHFMPTFFQQEIKKIAEVRTFFINNAFYSSIIFSQSDERTSVDFRNYNYQRPNRTPPFKLPLKIERKLNLLMEVLGLNSGSIDLIIGEDNKFYFLEVNPIGQFKQVSFPCNYNLEKIIAQYLINAKGNKSISKTK